MQLPTVTLATLLSSAVSFTVHPIDKFGFSTHKHEGLSMSVDPIQQPFETASPQLQQFDPMAYYQQQLQAWQQQMTAFAQFSAANPEAAATMTMPPPPPPPPTAFVPQQQQPVQPQPVQQPQAQTPAVQHPAAPAPASNKDTAHLDPKEFLPKGSGNKDAYEITNPADVYFAQLKRDSSVRNEARQRGDLETANKPFADTGVKALSSLLSEELIAQRREQLAANGGEFETSRDEMIIPFEEEEENVNEAYTGVSYKQKLLEMKKKKAGKETQTSNEQKAPVKSEYETSTAIPEAKPIAEKTVAAVDPEPKPVAATPANSSVPELNLKTEPDAESEEEAKPNFALKVAENFDEAPISAPSMEDSEETRKAIRTLMGLILKHRGGPGFGAGRLKDNEANKLTHSVSEVMALLKKEAGMEVESSVTDPATRAMPSAKESTGSSLDGAIACAEAALRMYESANGSSKQELLVPVRDALLSAATTIGKQIQSSSLNTMAKEESPQKPVFATSMEFPDTYKVTKEEEECEAPKKAAVAKTMEFPNTYKVTEVENEERSTEKSTISGTDSNTVILKSVFDTLKSSSGDGKYGLREIGSEEVTHIKDALHDMRRVLMDELDNGIPEKNTDVFRTVFDTLKSSSGDGKYGLREMGSEEITHIKDVLKDMRKVLMTELD